MPNKVAGVSRFVEGASCKDSTFTGIMSAVRGANGAIHGTDSVRCRDEGAVQGADSVAQ